MKQVLGYSLSIACFLLLAMCMQFICTNGTVNVRFFSPVQWTLEFLYLTIFFCLGSLLAMWALKPDNE